MDWPTSCAELIVVQRELAAATPHRWRPPAGTIGGVFVCFGRGGEGAGAAGDVGWGGAVVAAGGRLVASEATFGVAGARYEPGLLALREGPMLEAAVRSLGIKPDVLMVDATGRDHPRRAGLALHLGAVLGIPSVGVTHRPLVATGEWPPEIRSATTPLRIGDELVGHWVRTAPSARPLAVHAGWRIDPADAVAVVLASRGRYRTPEPLRQARRVARRYRSAAPAG